MSKLEELIDQLCPDGVEYVKIGEVVSYEQPTKYLVQSTDYNDSFTTPVLTAGQSFILGYTDELTGIYNATIDNPVIIFDDFTAAFKWVDFNFKVKSSAMKMLTANENKTTLRYIFHIMGYLNFSSDEHKRLWIGKYSNFTIPLPPLPVQEEIVRILDNITSLTAELTAELKARQKQYEYYRDALLSFDEDNAQDGVRWMKLGEIARFIYGYTGKAKDKGTVRYIRITDIGINGYLNPQDAKYIDLNDENEKYILQKGDLVMARTGATYGKTLYFDSDTPSVYASFLIKIEPSKVLNGRYYWHFSKSNLYWQQANKLVSTAGQPQFNANALANVVVPVPSIEEQQRIVDILDRFDNLCNDISEGLPAEIEARKKQYEYYRDKLLTFKEKEA